MTTGEKIYELRKKARITQEDFADKLGVTHQAVSKWESDTAFPETDTIIKIAELFGVSCDYLLKDGAVQHDNLIDNRRRSFLSMMVSFAIAACVVGYVVALICYYAINKYSAFIGFGVMAGFLLTGFILWSVGRYLFLSKCDWADADKQHLAKLTTAFLFTAIITFFCYLPAVLTGINIPSTLIFGCAGITVAMLVQMAHKYILGEKLENVRLSDLICICACAITAVGIFTAAVYERYQKILLGEVDTSPTFVPVAIFSLIIMIALITQASVRRKVYQTPKFLFSLQITGAILIFINCLIFFLSHYYHFESGLTIIYWFFALLLFVFAVVQIIFSAIYAKQGKKNVLPMLLYALPFYVFTWCMQIGCYFFLHDASTLLYLAWLLVAVNIYTATLQIVETIKTKKADKQ